MIWKISLVILATANGSWMLFDGINVLRTGKFFGPEIPGPWRHIPAAIGINPFSIGPVFIILGIGWLGAASMTVLKPDLAFCHLSPWRC